MAHAYCVCDQYQSSNCDLNSASCSYSHCSTEICSCEINPKSDTDCESNSEGYSHCHCKNCRNMPHLLEIPVMQTRAVVQNKRNKSGSIPFNKKDNGFTYPQNLQTFYDERKEYMSKRFTRLSLENDMTLKGCESKCPIHKTLKKSVDLHKLEENYWANWKPNKSQISIKGVQSKLSKTKMDNRFPELNCSKCHNMDFLNNPPKICKKRVKDLNNINMLSIFQKKNSVILEGTESGEDNTEYMNLNTCNSSTTPISTESETSTKTKSSKKKIKTKSVSSKKSLSTSTTRNSHYRPKTSEEKDLNLSQDEKDEILENVPKTATPEEIPSKTNSLNAPSKVLNNEMYSDVSAKSSKTKSRASLKSGLVHVINDAGDTSIQQIYSKSKPLIDSPGKENVAALIQETSSKEINELIQVKSSKDVNDLIQIKSSRDVSDLNELTKQKSTSSVDLDVLFDNLAQLEEEEANGNISSEANVITYQINDADDNQETKGEAYVAQSVKNHNRLITPTLINNLKAHSYPLKTNPKPAKKPLVTRTPRYKFK